MNPPSECRCRLAFEATGSDWMHGVVEFMGRGEGARLLLLERHKYVMVDPIKWIDAAPKWEKV